MEEKRILIPYRLCENIQVQQIDKTIFYIDLSRDYFIQLPVAIHEWILSPQKDKNLYKKYKKILTKLLDMKFIEIDLSSICLGKTSIYVSSPKSEFHHSPSFVQFYVDSISALNLLNNSDNIPVNHIINFVVDDNCDIIQKCSISGEIIINSYSALAKIAQIDCKRIRIESDFFPDEDELPLLIDTLQSRSVHIALRYTLSDEITTRLLQLKNSLKNSNLTLSYDLCAIFPQRANFDCFHRTSGISNDAIRKAKISCGAGTQKYFIDSNGNVYSCYRLRSSAPIGNISTSFIIEQNSYKNVVFPEACSSCNTRLFCGMGCLAEYNDYKYRFCNEIKTVIKDEYIPSQQKMPLFNIKLIEKHKDLTIYEYMCERNALRILLLGYNVNTPLLWMCCGLFINDLDFNNTGKFSTSFYRSMLMPDTFPIIGENNHSLDWDIIDAHLNNRQPVLMTVDVYHMPYKTQTYYHKIHGAHSIIVLNKTLTGYTILDWYHPDYYYGTISKDDLTIARLSTNEKNQISVFSGFPIQASYRLLHMENLPSSLNLNKYIRRNLYQSIKTMLGTNGILSMIQKAYQVPPNWLYADNHKEFINAIESLFFLDLELKLLIQYYNAMSKVETLEYLCPVKLLTIIDEVKKDVEIIKTQLIISYRKNKKVDDHIWINQFHNMYDHLSCYCETIIKSLQDDCDMLDIQKIEDR